jgi:hypothetical protein
MPQKVREVKSILLTAGFAKIPISIGMNKPEYCSFAEMLQPFRWSTAIPDPYKILY